MKNPILAMIPSGYNAADAKLYSILPVDGSGDFTVSVDADATRINKEGLIEGVALNQARLTYDPLNPECPSLLLEPTVTNLQVYSQEFDNVAWLKVQSTITANNTISPSGELNADKLQRTATSSSYVLDIISKSTDAKTYTTSVFVKQGEGDFFAMRAQGTYPSRVDLRFQFSTKQIIQYVASSSFTALSSNVEELKNGWFRISMTYTTDSHSALINYFSSRSSNGDTDDTDINPNANCFLWGCQVEENSYVTSYIPTVNSVTTRTRDLCTEAGNIDLFNVSKLSLFVDANNFKRNTGSLSYIVLTDGQSSPINMIRIEYRQDRIVVIVYDNGIDKLGYNIISVIPNQRNKLLLTFDNNEVKIYFNGVLRNISTSVPIPSGLDSLSFTNRTENAYNFQGEVHDARVYDRVLTETEAIKLTTI
tara:strand:+ start:1201 stop:2466 length:1266 start_codon:yes stop_codon:yes gene_type:complete